MGECSMAEDTKTDVVVATGEWGPPTTQREAARSQMLWMVGQAVEPPRAGGSMTLAGGAIERYRPCGT